MSERSMEVLISHIVEPPEFDADEEQLEKNFEKGIYESSKIDIIDSIGTPEFKDTWLVLKDDIKNETIKLQVIFSEQTLDKISEIYDFMFADKITLQTQFDLMHFYIFLQFLEYDNTNFLRQVWRFLGPKNLMELDIEKFCNANDDKIIKEIDEQLETHPQPELVALFLRTYYKSKMIEWFIKNSEISKVDITVSLLEREEKKNG